MKHFAARGEPDSSSPIPPPMYDGSSYFGKVECPPFSPSRGLFSATYLLFAGLCRQAFRSARYID